MKKETIQGPGIKIILDAGQIFPNDPGQGTPAMVETNNGKYSATFDCANDTGELSCGDCILTPRQGKWLENQIDYVYDWLEKNTNDNGQIPDGDRAFNCDMCLQDFDGSDMYELDGVQVCKDCYINHNKQERIIKLEGAQIHSGETEL